MPAIRTPVDDLVKWLDPPKGGLWHGGASTLGCLRGVTAEAAAWKPAPDRLSIWELTLHVAYTQYIVHRRLVAGAIPPFPRSPANFPALPALANEAAWKADRALLRKTHRELLEVVRHFAPDRLDQSSGASGAWTWMDLISGIVLHDAYHTGQIQLMKRLYRSLHRDS